MSKGRSSRPGPLRKALAARTSLRTYYDIPTAETEDVERARRHLDTVRQMEAATLLSDNPDVAARVQQGLEQAEAAYAACFHRVWFRGLPLDEFDALVLEHPPTPEDAKAERIWNDDFEFALLAAAAVDNELTPEEWKTELATWPVPEQSRIRSAALSVQRQTMADHIPKG